MKGIIVEQRKSKTVVLTETGLFLSISKRNADIGEKIVFHRKKNSTIAVSLCVVILLLSVSLFFIPIGSVFLDVNPSICLTVNPFGNVISAQGLNEDGTSLLQGNHFFFCKIQPAVEKFLFLCEAEGFFGNTANSVEIRIDEALKISHGKLTGSASALSSENIEVSVFKISKKDSKKARKKSIPAKRVRAISIYTQHFGGTFEENEVALRGYSSEDILDLVLGQKIEKNTDSKKKEDAPRKENAHFSSKKRKDAIQAYTKAFGGNDAENAELLQGITNKKIYEMIESKKEKEQ